MTDVIVHEFTVQAQLTFTRVIYIKLIQATDFVLLRAIQYIICEHFTYKAKESPAELSRPAALAFQRLLRLLRMTYTRGTSAETDTLTVFPSQISVSVLTPLPPPY